MLTSVQSVRVTTLQCTLGKCTSGWANRQNSCPTAPTAMPLTPLPNTKGPRAQRTRGAGGLRWAALGAAGHMQYA